MAKLKSLLKIEGTLGGITFYKTKDGNLAREKGGVSRERIMRDPRFERTRENIAEFKQAANAGKLLRDSIVPLLMTARDSRVTSRLTKIMIGVCKNDTVSFRGERNPAFGLNSDEGKALLKSFNFNLASPLNAILFKAFALDPATGKITIENLVPNEDMAIPVGATHISLSGAMLNIDFETGIYSFKMTNVQNIATGMTPTSIALVPTEIPSGSGAMMYFLKIAFFQEVNGKQYSLRNGAFNSLELVEIG